MEEHTVVRAPGEELDGSAVLLCLGCGFEVEVQGATAPPCPSCVDERATAWAPVADLLELEDGHWYRVNSLPC